MTTPRKAPAKRTRVSSSKETNQQKIDRISKLPAAKIIEGYKKAKEQVNQANALFTRYRLAIAKKEAEKKKPENAAIKASIQQEIDRLTSLMGAQTTKRQAAQKNRILIGKAYFKKTKKKIEDVLKKQEEKKKPAVKKEKPKKKPKKAPTLKSQWEALLKKNPHPLQTTNKTLHTTLQGIKTVAPAAYKSKITTLTSNISKKFAAVQKKISGKSPTERAKQYKDLLKKDKKTAQAIIWFSGLADMLKKAKTKLKALKTKPQLAGKAIDQLITDINGNKSISVIETNFNKVSAEKKAKKPSTPENIVKQTNEKYKKALDRLSKAQALLNKIKKALGNSNEHHSKPLQDWLTRVHTEMLNSQKPPKNRDVITNATDAADRVCAMVEKVGRSNKTQIIPALKAINKSLSLINDSKNLNQAMDAANKFYKENPAIPGKHRMWVALIGAAAKRFPGVADGLRSVLVFIERYPMVKQWFDAVFGEGVKSALVKIAYGNHYKDRKRMVKHIQRLAGKFRASKGLLYGSIRYSTFNPLFRAYVKNGYKNLTRSQMESALNKTSSSWQKIRNKSFLKKFNLSKSSVQGQINNMMYEYGKTFRKQPSNRQSYLLQLGSYGMLKALFPISATPSTTTTPKPKKR